ncbi:hypothetical protein D3C81_967060 [compost metagenome]
MRGNAGAAIADRHVGTRGIAPRAHAEARLAVDDSVLHQVHQQPHQADRAIGNGRQFRQRQLELMAQAGEVCGELRHQRVDVAGLRLLFLAAAGVVHELLQDGLDVVQVALGRGHEGIVGAARDRHGHGQAQLGQRRADVVRDTRQHQCPRLLGLLQRLRHLVEGAADLGDLGRPVGRQRRRCRARADVLRGTREVLQRPVQVALDQVAGQRRQQRQRGRQRQRRGDAAGAHVLADRQADPAGLAAHMHADPELFGLAGLPSHRHVGGQVAPQRLHEDIALPGAQQVLQIGGGFRGGVLGRLCLRAHARSRDTAGVKRHCRHHAVERAHVIGKDDGGALDARALHVMQQHRQRTRLGNGHQRHQQQDIARQQRARQQAPEHGRRPRHESTPATSM